MKKMFDVLEGKSISQWTSPFGFLLEVVYIGNNNNVNENEKRQIKNDKKEKNRTSSFGTAQPRDH